MSVWRSGVTPPWRSVLAAISGALLTFAFAPYNLWPLAIVCPALLFALWQDATPRAAARIGFSFGAGLFALGTWWLYISIRQFGSAALWLTLLLMVALVAIMSLWYALLGYLAARWLPRAGVRRWLLGLPGLWVLIEWLRGWVASGFPWLTLGYSQTDTWLKSFAPIGGVYALSALLAVFAGALVTLWLGRTRQRAIALVVLIAPWPMGLLLARHSWTRPAGDPVPVAVLQGAFAPDVKWLESNNEATRALYRKLNTEALGARLIVWPESAIPELANSIVPYLSGIYGESRAHGSDLVIGLVRANLDTDQYYNSVMVLSDKPQWYDKRHLVPFAEYFPVPAFVRQWLRLMSLPYSDFTAGSEAQGAYSAGGTRLALTICYEDVFGAAQRKPLAEAELLVNVTNDAWFGHSAARYQHFQMGRMRVLEADRPLVRAANDGLSALVDADGRVLATAPEYQPAVLRGTVQPRQGLTPYARAGDWPVLVLAGIVLVLARPWRRRTAWSSRA
ncbi:MAG: apolipoprotein N-acyltransferase [Steroidobacteraceae bacterium]